MLPPTPYAFSMRVLPLFFTIVLFVAASLKTLSPGPDPYRCGGLTNNGSWLHPPDENGARFPFTNWQPDGCMLKQYNQQDIHDCLGNQHVVFSGDSTTRQIFWAMARLLDRPAALDARRRAGIHEDYRMIFNGIRMMQLWNPMLETGQLNQDLTNELNVFADVKLNGGVGDGSKDAPAFIMLGAGSWYALENVEQQAISMYEKAVQNVSDIVQLEKLPPFGTAPMHPVDGVGNEIFMAPVFPPFMNELPQIRQGPYGIQVGEIDHIDEMLEREAESRRIRMLWSYYELPRNQPAAIVDKNSTGFHVIDTVAETKAQIVLNLRCNARLDNTKGYPYDRTCCTDYGEGTRPFIQKALIFLTTLYVCACLCFEVFDLASETDVPRLPFVNMKVGMFAVALLYCFIADRTHFFAKGSKEFVGSEFGTLIILGLIAGVFTIRKSIARKSKHAGGHNAPDFKEDHGVLSRDQTDEWKGWMQAVILIYHWTGASRYLPVYIFIRLLVASYLFQTGYGHTIYFLSKKDFSFDRVAAVMLRLNLLSCALPYIMGTDYMFYYFAPLVSYWFLIVYATLAIGAKYNDNPTAVAAKVLISFVGVWFIMTWTPVCGWVFAVLKFLFRIDWDLHEWEFRASLDGVIVYVGMLCGLAYTKISRGKSIWTDFRMAIPASVAVLYGYGHICLIADPSKAAYNRVHPFVSFLPIIAFIGLRNAITPLRNHYSAVAAWLGRCSLETFILQFHVFLAADTKGVVLLDAFRGADGSLWGDRWRDLVIIVPIFLWISSCVSDATTMIVQAMTRKTQDEPYDAEYGLGADGRYKLLEGFKQPLFTRFLSLSRRSFGSLRVQCGALLLGMWLLNLLY